MGFGEFKTGILRFAYFKWGLGDLYHLLPPSFNDARQHELCKIAFISIAIFKTQDVCRHNIDSSVVSST